MRGGPSVLIYSAAVRMDGGVDLNLGDEALSDCLAAGIVARAPHAQVRRLVSVAGERVGLGPHELALRDLGGLLRAVRTADVVVLGGGTLLQDDPGLLRWQVLIATLARALGKPVVVAAVGAEGLRAARFRWAARYVCRRATVLTVRDRASSELLGRVSGREATVVADPVLLTYSLLEQFWLDELSTHRNADGPFIAVNLTREAPQGFVDALAVTLGSAIAEGTRVVGVATDRRPERDSSALGRLGEALGWPEQYTLLPAEASWREVSGVLGGAELCIGMRLHFLLLASIAGAPVVAVTTLPKTVAFAAEFEIERVAPDVSIAELREAMGRAHGVRVEILQAMGARAEQTIERILAAANTRPDSGM